MGDIATIDSSCVHVHQQGANAKMDGSAGPCKGRSRRGLTAMPMLLSM